MVSAPDHPDVVVEPKLLGPLAPDDLLAAYAQAKGDLDTFLAALNLSGRPLLLFIEDPEIARRRAVIDAFLAQAASRRSVAQARLSQDIAARELARHAQSHDNPIESRRAATSLGNLVRNWDRFDPTAPTAPKPRVAPPPRAQRPAPPPPTPTPPRPLLTEKPSLADHPIKAVSLIVEAYQTHGVGAHRRAEHLAAQLAKGATLDHKPIPPDACLDPSILAQFVLDSTLTDVKGTYPADFSTLSHTPTTALVRVLHNAKRDQVLVDLSVSRQNTSSPWLIHSITSPNRPPPQSSEQGASVGPAPP